MKIPCYSAGFEDWWVEATIGHSMKGPRAMGVLYHGKRKVVNFDVQVKASDNTFRILVAKGAQGSRGFRIPQETAS